MITAAYGSGVNSQWKKWLHVCERFISTSLEGRLCITENIRRPFSVSSCTSSPAVALQLRTDIQRHMMKRIQLFTRWREQHSALYYKKKRTLSLQNLSIIIYPLIHHYLSIIYPCIQSSSKYPATTHKHIIVSIHPSIHPCSTIHQSLYHQSIPRSIHQSMYPIFLSISDPSFYTHTSLIYPSVYTSTIEDSPGGCGQIF